MKATTLFKSCLPACSVLAGAQALADPGSITQPQNTVNSIEFSFMHYSSPPLPVFSLPLTVLENTVAAPPAPSLPVFVPTPQELLPAIEAALPTQPGQLTPQPAETAAEDVAAAAIPAPGSLALLGLGLLLAGAFARPQRQEGGHD